ncbi:MAG: alpha/beta hydrolase domain-containing protein [Bryobacterales bacterium]
MRRCLFSLLPLLLFAAQFAAARLVRLEHVERSPVLEGREWGLAGPYETVKARAYFALDPRDDANLTIADLTRAPRNAQGEVELSADVYLIKPVALERGNRTVLLEINNRGNKGMLGMFDRAEGSLAPSTAEQFGDGLLLEQGYTLLWVGWQFDPPRDKNKMFVYPPVAQGPGGKPIRGLARADFVTTDREYSHSLADRDHIPYEVADPDAAENVLTVRERVDSERRVIPREKWRFGRMENGAVVEDRGRVWLEGGFEPNKIYEVVYVTEDPPLVGGGAAAVRDFVSYLKYDSSEALGVEPGVLQHAIGFGISQSGRFLRTFLYYGFNRDERARRVFDGVIAHVAGGGRGSFNHRFAQPSRDAHPFLNFLYPTDIFPFSDVVQKDPESGLEDGLLARYRGHEQWLPKIFYTNSSYEYWGRAASLIHTTIDGKRDIEIPDNVRIYHIAGTQHGPGSFPPRVSLGQQPSNAVDYRWALRGLLAALQDWVAADREPPPSRYGKIADKTLVAPEALNWPKIPGVGYSTRIHKAYRADYGPRFYSEGVVENEPPKIGSAYPVLAPAVDADGNEVTGIRLPEVAVPLATHTGWNLFNAKSGPTDELSSMQGSFVVFPKTKAEREAKGDPRLSIEERYPSREDYVGRVAEAAVNLAEQGYVLESDVPAMIRSAAEKWDALTAQ